MLFYVVFVRKCVLYYCRRVSTQLQLTNVLISIFKKKDNVRGLLSTVALRRMGNGGTVSLILNLGTPWNYSFYCCYVCAVHCICKPYRFYTLGVLQITSELCSVAVIVLFCFQALCHTERVDVCDLALRSRGSLVVAIRLTAEEN